jgi:ankyrin repeat protein
MHTAVQCLEIILRYAQEAHMKDELLDAQDAFGETALHLAIKHQYVHAVKKLILEGADLFIK